MKIQYFAIYIIILLIAPLKATKWIHSGGEPIINESRLVDWSKAGLIDMDVLYASHKLIINDFDPDPTDYSGALQMAIGNTD